LILVPVRAQLLRQASHPCEPSCGASGDPLSD
jgi:hypothetical protein